jgi:hypothetical protein
MAGGLSAMLPTTNNNRVTCIGCGSILAIQSGSMHKGMISCETRFLAQVFPGYAPVVDPAWGLRPGPHVMCLKKIVRK